MTEGSATVYERWLGEHASSLGRLVLGLAAGLVAGVALAPFVPWQTAVLGGWDAAALAFLASVWPVIVRADGLRTARIAVREDATRESARLLLTAASVASLVAVGFILELADHETGGQRVALVTMAALTVVLSWTVVNTVFTLRYADLFYRSPPAGITFGASEVEAQPDYRDFAYLAFTIGMTYQVSDTALKNRDFRRTVLVHALLSYVFGAVIVATVVNIVGGLG